MLSTELTNSAQRQETIQKNLISSFEKEEKLQKKNSLLLQQYEKGEKVMRVRVRAGIMVRVRVDIIL
jgi:hypothetical protein